jgi:ubiquinone/menaquinone biosynthesis C-methylase UbiE
MVNSPYVPNEYHQSRPEYPAELILPLRSGLPMRPKILDLACGTGLLAKSAEAVLGPWVPEWWMLDPNPELLKLLNESGDWAQAKTVLASAEQTGLGSAMFDLVLVGSAWHWFQGTAADEVCRILKAGGLFWVGEYQFPKLELGSKPQGEDTLNDWVRRQFNEVWKFSEQQPRGGFAEITQPIQAHRDLHLKSVLSCSRVRSLELHDFANLIFSQARFLDFEARTKSLDERKRVLATLVQQFSSAFPGNFRYQYEARIFKKRLI